MTPDRSLVERVAQVAPTSRAGIYYRHAAPSRDAFAGGTDGRWGASFPVVYLADSEAGAIVEAYRHLVEELNLSPDRVRPRDFYTVNEQVTDLLDLTVVSNQQTVGLAEEDFRSPVGDYGACQRVAAAAHQLGRHGIVAPAAHGLGTTLALFRRNLGLAELPKVTSSVTWQHLPPDPRQGRAVLRAVEH